MLFQASPNNLQTITYRERWTGETNEAVEDIPLLALPALVDEEDEEDELLFVVLLRDEKQEKKYLFIVSMGGIFIRYFLDFWFQKFSPIEQSTISSNI